MTSAARPRRQADPPTHSLSCGNGRARGMCAVYRDLLGRAGRSGAVERYLVAQGVAASARTTVSHGEEKPLFRVSSEDGGWSHALSSRGRRSRPG